MGGALGLSYLGRSSSRVLRERVKAHGERISQADALQDERSRMLFQVCSEQNFHSRRFYESHKNAGLQHGSRDCIVCLPGLNSKDSLRVATQRREGNWPERRDSNLRAASCVTGRRSKPGCSWGHPLRSSLSRRFELMKEIKMLGRISKCAVSPF